MQNPRSTGESWGKKLPDISRSLPASKALRARWPLVRYAYQNRRKLFRALGIGLVAPPEDQPQRCAVEAEGLAELVDQVPLVGEMDVVGLIGEDHEGRRTGGYLCGIVELDPSAVCQRR